MRVFGLKRVEAILSACVVRPAQGSGFGDDSEEKQLQRNNNYGSDSFGGRALREETELVKEELRINNNNRNPVAKAMSSSIGALATVGLFIYGFGMLYGNKGEVILGRWRMTSLSSPEGGLYLHAPA